MLGVFMVHVLFGAGNILFFAKELIIFSVCGLVVDRFVLLPGNNACVKTL